MKAAKNTHPNSKFNVITPSTVAGVRGTDFSVFAGQEGATRVEVYQGIVSAADLTGQAVELHAGQFTEIIRGRPPAPPQWSPGPPPPLESTIPDAKALAMQEVYQEISKEAVLAQAQQELQSAAPVGAAIQIEVLALREERSHGERPRREKIGIVGPPLLYRPRHAGRGEHVVLPQRLGEERCQHRPPRCVPDDVVVEFPPVLVRSVRTEYVLQ